ncbi:MAG: hypothetical protein ABFS23_01795 [Pseudomonadota bacterium]
MEHVIVGLFARAVVKGLLWLNAAAWVAQPPRPDIAPEDIPASLADIKATV